jgi:DNA-binding response OmpR family regulator
MTRPKILVVEDEADILDVLEYTLAREGFRVLSTRDGSEATAIARREAPRLVLLDLMLPGLDGLEVCRRLKADAVTRDIPVVMLTAKGEESDIVLGLGLGADDYVTKPFSPRELGARIEALSRRPRQTGTVEVAERAFGDLVIRPDVREVEVAGTEVELTRIEFDLLDQLTTNAPQVLTRAQLLDSVWGGEWFGDDHVVDVHIANLRKKLAQLTDRSIIRTVRSVGYGLAT